MIYFRNTVRATASSPWYWILTIFITVPVKYEHVVFCGLSDFQLSLYRLFISSPEIKALLRGANSQPLKAINILKKLCNHPELLNLPEDLQGSEHLIPDGFVGAEDQVATAGAAAEGTKPFAVTGVASSSFSKGECY